MARRGNSWAWAGLSVLAVLNAVSGYIGMSGIALPTSLAGFAGHFRAEWVVADDTVPISDTDQLRETCSGMYGGSEAFIEGQSPHL